MTLVPFALLAIWARSASPAPWELGLLDAVAVGPGFSGDIVHATNALGNLPVWAIVVAVAAAFAAVIRGVYAALLVALSFASDLAAFAVKMLVERDRPDTPAVEQFFGDSSSFPSGHTVRAAALVAVVIWLIAPAKWRVPLAVTGGVIAGAVMGYARISLGVHWPTDAVGGTLVGIAWFALTAWLFWPRVTSSERRR